MDLLRNIFGYYSVKPNTNSISKSSETQMNTQFHITNVDKDSERVRSENAAIILEKQIQEKNKNVNAEPKTDLISKSNETEIKTSVQNMNADKASERVSSENIANFLETLIQPNNKVKKLNDEIKINEKAGHGSEIILSDAHTNTQLDTIINDSIMPNNNATDLSSQPINSEYINIEDYSELPKGENLGNDILICDLDNTSAAPTENINDKNNFSSNSVAIVQRDNNINDSELISLNNIDILESQDANICINDDYIMSIDNDNAISTFCETELNEININDVVDKMQLAVQVNNHNIVDKNSGPDAYLNYDVISISSTEDIENILPKSIITNDLQNVQKQADHSVKYVIISKGTIIVTNESDTIKNTPDRVNDLKSSDKEINAEMGDDNTNTARTVEKTYISLNVETANNIITISQAKLEKEQHFSQPEIIHGNHINNEKDTETLELPKLEIDIDRKNSIQIAKINNTQELETISISSEDQSQEIDPEGKIKRNFSIDSDSDNESSGYHSSDFEFITEEEAQEDGLIIHYREKHINPPKTVKHPKINTIEISVINHKIPEGEFYNELFNGIYAPHPMYQFGMESKSLAPTEVPIMNVDFEQMTWFQKGDENVDDETKLEAMETAKKILDKYPRENKKRRRH